MSFEIQVFVHFYPVYRGILPRLILFVVDLSGSMGQTITVEGPKGNLHSSSNAEKDRLVKLSK